ncbi:hypothetical protein CRYUN_Cryun32bG0114400 [Craigia yunnanensis]
MEKRRQTVGSSAMEAFEKLEKLGEGTYGKVYRARESESAVITSAGHSVVKLLNHFQMSSFSASLSQCVSAKAKTKAKGVFRVIKENGASSGAVFFCTLLLLDYFIPHDTSKLSLPL